MDENGIVPFTLEELKALSSRTRLQTLALLREKPMTLAEISRKTGLNRSTMHQHLKILQGAGFTQKNAETQKRTYHSLTDRAKEITQKKTE